MREAKTRGADPSGPAYPIRSAASRTVSVAAISGPMARAAAIASATTPIPAHAWVGPPRHQSRVWEQPIQAQLRGLDVSSVTIARIAAALSKPSVPDNLLLRQRNERQRRELALDYAAARLDEPAFLSAVAALRLEPEAPAPTPAGDAADIAHYLTDIAGSLRKLDKLAMSGDLSEPERAEWWARMTAAVYARFTIVGTTFVYRSC